MRKRNPSSNPAPWRWPRCDRPFAVAVAAGCSVLAVFIPPPTEAHQVSAVGAEAKFFRGGTYVFAVSLEVEASLDPERNDEISPEQAVLNYLRDGITFQFDDEVVEPDFSPPEPVQPGQESVQGVLPRVQLYSEAKGRIPPGADAFYAKLSPETDVALVLLVEKDGVRERRARTIFAGETSRPVDLTFLDVPRRGGDPFSEENEADPRPLFRAGTQWLLRDEGKPALLLMALLLASASLQQLALQALAFFGAAFLGQILSNLQGQPPSGMLTSLLLGFLLAAVAGHNLRFRGAGSGWRLVLAALAGLLAGVLLPGKPLPGFLGGQLLSVLIVAVVLWAVLGGFWKASWYRPNLVRPASWLLFGVSLYWVVEGFTG